LPAGFELLCQVDNFACSTLFLFWLLKNESGYSYFMTFKKRIRIFVGADLSALGSLHAIPYYLDFIKILERDRLSIADLALGNKIKNER